MFDLGLGITEGENMFRNLSFIDLREAERCFARHYGFGGFCLHSASLLVQSIKENGVSMEISQINKNLHTR